MGLLASQPCRLGELQASGRLFQKTKWVALMGQQLRLTSALRVHAHNHRHVCASTQEVLSMKRMVSTSSAGAYADDRTLVGSE